MIRIEQINKESIEKAHAHAISCCWSRTFDLFEFDMTDYYVDFYARDFIEALLNIVLDEEWPPEEKDWTIEELAEELDTLGFRTSMEDYGNTKVLNIHYFYAIISLEDDEDGKILTIGSNEYIIGRWDHDIVNLISVIGNEITADKLHDRNEEYIKEYNRQKLQHQVRKTTAYGIIHDKFRGKEHTIYNDNLKHEFFECDIETEGGIIHVEGRLNQLSEQLDNILKEKQRLESFMTDFDDIDFYA